MITLLSVLILVKSYVTLSSLFNKKSWQLDKIQSIIHTYVMMKDAQQ